MLSKGYRFSMRTVTAHTSAPAAGCKGRVEGERRGPGETEGTQPCISVGRLARKLCSGSRSGRVSSSIWAMRSCPHELTAAPTQLQHEFSPDR